MLSLVIAIASGFAFAVPAHAQGVPAGVVLLDISKAKWEKGLVGDKAKTRDEPAEAPANRRPGGPKDKAGPKGQKAPGGAGGPPKASPAK